MIAAKAGVREADVLPQIRISSLNMTRPPVSRPLRLLSKSAVYFLPETPNPDTDLNTCHGHIHMTVTAV